MKLDLLEGLKVEARKAFDDRYLYNKNAESRPFPNNIEVYTMPNLENAFLHAYVSAKLSKILGETTTLNLGYIKELTSKNQEIANFGSRENAFLDTNRDLWNNQMAINLAKNNATNSNEELADLIFNNLIDKNSDFIIDYKNDSRRWDENSNPDSLWDDIVRRLGLDPTSTQRCA